MSSCPCARAMRTSNSVEQTIYRALKVRFFTNKSSCSTASQFVIAVEVAKPFRAHRATMITIARAQVLDSGQESDRKFMKDRP